MKKAFITAVAEQTGRFDSPVYISARKDLINEKNEHYPIFNVMENNTKRDDEIELIAIKFPGEALERNYGILSDRAKLFEQNHGLSVKLTPIEHIHGESNKAHSSLFNELINKIDDRCQISADITYGTKPTPMIIFAVLCFIDSVRINSEVKQIVYGKINWKRVPDAPSEIESAYIYDVTRLLKIIKFTESLKSFNGNDVESAVKMFLDIESGE